MNEQSLTNHSLSQNDALATQQPYFPEYVDTIFEHLAPQDVERFHRNYQLWLLQRRIETFNIEIEILQEAVESNASLMQQVQPSAVALASLVQLQASGVTDIDLLEKMLDRGEQWLDYTMQLLKYCEEQDVIGGDYNQWCAHALEGAYDWIASIHNGEERGTEALPAVSPTSTNQALNATTEEQLLLKLMSDEEDNTRRSLLNLSKNEQAAVEVPSPTEQTDLQAEQELALAASNDTTLPADKTETILQEIMQPVEAAHTEKMLVSDEEVIAPLELPVLDTRTKATSAFSEDDQRDSTIQAAQPSTRITRPLELPVEQAEQKETEQTDQTDQMPRIIMTRVTRPLKPALDPEVQIPKLTTTRITRPLELPVQQEELIEQTEQTEQTDQMPRIVMTHITYHPFEAHIAPVEQYEPSGKSLTAEEESSAVDEIQHEEIRPQEVQLQPVRQGGFWGFLRRLLAKILRR